MATTISSIGELSDHDLLAQVKCAAEQERQATARLIALLMELDTRRLHLGEGFSSLFTYCTHVLRLSEHAAYGRIEAARTARQFPMILTLLQEGAVTLTTINLLTPHLTESNHREVLDSARHKSKREVELLIAELHPRPAVPTVVRKLPTRQATEVPAPMTTFSLMNESSAKSAPPPSVTSPRPAVVTPLSPERYKVQLTVTRETYEKLRRAQDLLRHSIP